jgi:hypothetical protein
MLLFELAESGTTAAPPVLTITKPYETRCHVRKIRVLSRVADTWIEGTNGRPR